MKNNTNYISLFVPNNLRYLPLVLDSTVSFTRILGLDEKTANEIQLGVEEAVVNVIDHAFAEDEQERFELILQETALGLEITIKEQGMPFDPEELDKLGHQKSFDAENTKGLGLRLMYQYMDEVSFINLGKDGKETRLVKYLGRISETAELPDTTANQQPEPMPAFQIRPMLPQEAVEVSKCAYMAYGYSYSNEHVYFPERLRQLNEEGTMVSLVAVSEDNEILGHIALIFNGDDMLVPVVDDAFVTPKYRGSGCLNDLGEATIAWARANGIAGLYTWAVTTHVYSQRVGYKWNLRDTAILVSSDLPFEFKAIEYGGQRESETILFRYMAQIDSVELYAPAHHTDIISQIYGHLGVQAKFWQPDPETELPDSEAVVELKYDPSIIAFITVNKYGRNVVDEVKHMLKDLRLQRIETIYLYLPLNSPFTALMTGVFEQMEFFFSGIMPGSEGKDKLILQYLNNQIIDYSQIHINTEFGRQLLAYIQTHDPNQAPK
ncbi:MAG TPA: GNAT family N-acetyltransferase [Syntrophomonas sp.]|nr:GNAT family N-acetyltransferase [Syntrophomonas sp.]